MNYKKWLEKNTSSLEGKTVAVSGSTGGIGRELCAFLCQLCADLILIDRNPLRSEALRDELLQRFPNRRIKCYSLDLEDTEAVSLEADKLLSEKIDYLILNAGAYKIPRAKGKNGYVNVFNINFVSPYLLACRLLPKISERGGRVVAVGSVAHNYSVSDPADVDFASRTACSKIYGNSKRYLMFSLWGLDEYQKNISVTHPGITVTNITAHYPRALYAIIKYPMKLIFMNPKKASLSILRGLFEDTEKNEWIGPRFFGVWGIPKKRILTTCSDGEAQRICNTAKEILKNE